MDSALEGQLAYRVDEGEVLERLSLNATEAALVTGVTVRQLTYWTDKGIIPTSPRDNRSYGIDALQKTVMIRRGMEAGLTLEKAVQTVEAKLASEEVRRAEIQALSPAELRAILETELAAMSDRVRTYRAQLSLHLAVCRLKASVAVLDELLAGSDLVAGPSAPSPERRQAFARRVGQAAQELERAIAEIRPAAGGDDGADIPGYRR